MVERPSASFALLLVAGLLILFFGISVSGFFYVISPYCARTSEIASLMFLDALICGIVVLTAGILLYALPKYHVLLGVLGLIFSISSFLSAGGLFIGMIMGTIGGVTAIDWKSAVPLTRMRYLLSK